MLDFKPVPRHRVQDEVEVSRLMAAQEPFIIEEGDNPAFQRFAEQCSREHITELFGDREWRVQDFNRGPFDPTVSPVENTTLMPFSEFMKRIDQPDDGHQSYVNVWPSEGNGFALPFFEKMMALGRELPLTMIDNQELKTLWVGGAGTTSPLHYDTYARSHGTVSGMKQYIFFPPDVLHYRRLGTHSIRSACGWWSRIGFGPIDDTLYPQLAGLEPWIAQCRPGDFVWLPPCWWHHVSIPDEPTVTISATHHDRRTYRHWYHWRMRMTRWIGRHEGVKRLVQGRSA